MADPSPLVPLNQASPARVPLRSPQRSGGFGKLLFGQTVSAVGSQVTFVALPLIAVLTMHATPAAMGVLGALDNLPYLLIGLWVGVFVDRYPCDTCALSRIGEPLIIAGLAVPGSRMSIGGSFYERGLQPIARSPQGFAACRTF